MASSINDQSRLIECLLEDLAVFVAGEFIILGVTARPVASCKPGPLPQGVLGNRSPGSQTAGNRRGDRGPLHRRKGRSMPRDLLGSERHISINLILDTRPECPERSGTGLRQCLQGFLPSTLFKTQRPGAIGFRTTPVVP